MFRVRGPAFTLTLGLGLVGCASDLDRSQARRVYVPREDAHHVEVDPGRSIYLPRARAEHPEALNPGARAPEEGAYREDPPPPDPAGSR